MKERPIRFDVDDIQQRAIKALASKMGISMGKLILDALKTHPKYGPKLDELADELHAEHIGRVNGV